MTFRVLNVPMGGGSLSPKFYHFLLLPLSINRLMIPMVVVVKWDIIVEVFAPFCVEMIYIWAFTT